MSPDQIVEATLFASQTPLTPAELARADEALDARLVRESLDRLRSHYERDDRAFQIYQLGDGFQILTRPEFAPYLERFDSVPRPPTLSRAALETLAIVAYRQPIGRIEVEEIRGVASTSVLRTLQDWDLISIVGRGEGLGRPLLYGTTKHFLDHFGFQSLRELPQPEDLPIALVRPESEGGLEDLVVGKSERPDTAAEPEAAATPAEPEAAATPAEPEAAATPAPETVVMAPASDASTDRSAVAVSEPHTNGSAPDRTNGASPPEPGT